MDWENRTVSLLLCLSILLATIHDGNAERKIVCYYTNWSIYRPGTAKFSPQNINPYLCTHLIYAFGGFTKENSLKPFDKYQDIEKGGYAKFTGLKTYNKNLKTLLAIGGWNEGSSRFSPMVADPERRREFVKNAIKFLRKNHFDGLDLDWEYPAFRDGGKPRDKDNYANLMQELREEFEREASKTGRPRLLLTLAMPAGIEYIDKGYDVPRINEYLDFINLLSYDYHSSYEPAVNHHSPLYPLEEDNEYNYDSELTIDYTINYLLKKGASSEKIILGIPTYGRSYTLFNQDATDLGSPADGPGVEGDATREKGYLAYYEICESLGKSDEWEVIQPNPRAMGPYAFKEDQWVGYDDEEIVKLKAKYVNEKDLGGIMFWTIDNDDFRGKCHDRPYPLIEAAKEALLSANKKTVQKAKTVESRKQTRVQGVQSNVIGRRLGSNARRRSTTTAAPAPKKRVPSSRPRYRTFSRSKASDEEEEEDEEIGRRSYHSPSDDEENSEGGNAVSIADKNRSGPKARSNSNRNRRKQERRREESRGDSQGDSLSNTLTTPEPPTTPDPGTDFKCEDEGFFPHPRDCKKYFWCLDSGPSGLGVVAHQFTCPSGLVFNKAADSCDYPRNVVCPKTKTSQATASTTRAPIVAATSRTTYLYSTTRRPTTQKPVSAEEYEYYDEDEHDDDDDDAEVEEEATESKEKKKEPKVAATPKTLLYKTITRNKPTTTTTTTTEAQSTTSRSERNEPVKLLDIEDEEDPRVIKELINLIKKAGGIEHLEKQLLLQDNSADNAANSAVESATPATISRTLYERVLNRQASKPGNRERPSTGASFANGPGRAQFEGLDEIPEVQSLRRSQRPQYVTIERPKPSTSEPPIEDEDDDDDDNLDDDNEDVASSEEQTVNNAFLSSSTQSATPNYVNIRRPRPSTSRTENDVDDKDKNTEEETPVRRRRPSASSKNIENSSTKQARDEESRSPINEGNAQTTKSRYVSVQRFRSTTPQPAEVASVVASTVQEAITESVVSKEVDVIATTPSINVPSPIALSSTPNDILVGRETEKSVSNEASQENATSTTESVRLVEDTATEILLTTAPASLSTLLAPNAKISTASVSQPRPFGFNRRNRPSTEITTTPLPAPNDQTRSKVANSEVNRLPTLKELIGYRTNDYTNSPAPVLLSLLPRSAKDREVYSREKDIILRPANKIYTVRNDFDLSDDKIVADYVVDNVADDEDDASLASKKRIDREDSLITTLRPTTTRGIPLLDLLQSQYPRGFYVTRDETNHRAAEKVANDTLNVETTNSPSESDAPAKKTDQPYTNGETTIDYHKYSTELITTVNSDSVAHDRRDTSDGSTTTEIPLITSSARTSNANRKVIETIASSSEQLSANDYTTPSIKETDSTLGVAAEIELNGALTTTETNVLESSTEAGPNTRNETSATNLEPSSTAHSSSTFTERPRTDQIENKVYRRRQKVNLERGNQFGEKSRRRERFPYARPSTENQKEPTKEVEGTEYPRRLVTNYRGRHRFREKPNALKRMETTAATPVNETELNKSVENANHQGGSIEGETSDRKKLVPKANQTRSNADSLEEQLRIEENIDGFKAEVNTSTNTETTRTSGNFSSARLKKPTTLALTALRSRTSNTIASHRKPRPTDGNSTIFNEKVDEPGEINETAKLEKDIDQSSKAQEIAVTLADPPSSQSTPTGRSPFRNALRRKVSSTIAPRTDTTTIRTTLGFASTLKDRQRPKTTDKPLRNVTTRTRRPPVLDYDYYEDEEVPVIGKTSLNEKLFLTSKGTIRCLDQGNFPHPYSCKKFITCARMVNGLVIGAEYTCPDKLSFDPVGGICNWSAGIGCKE